MHKYRLLKEDLLKNNVINSSQLIAAPEVTIKDLMRAHDAEYINSIKNLTLPKEKARPIGLPLSYQLYQRSLISTGGFVAASETALNTGYSVLLAGGTHHAHRDAGEGFCVFNDFAVAALKLLADWKVKKIIILDLDVHQGNGNSSILAKHDNIFICSIHGEKNYPYKKVPSNLDLALPPGTTDEDYLHQLEIILNQLPTGDILFYQAGVDVLKYDKFGSFNLSFEGVKTRDLMVFEWAKKHSMPVAQAIGGGYSDPIEHTIKAYCGTIEVAKACF
jgi:acetoin utilization deacetylase AcuC-like enzyme